MSDDAATAPRPRTLPVLAAAAGALAAGGLAAVFGLQAFVAVGALALVCAAALKPREAALATALASPLNNIIVVHVPNLLDLRFTQVMWFTILASVLWRAFVLRRPVPMRMPPRWLTLGLAGLVGWHLTSALVNGQGVRSFVKVAQIGGFALILWLLAATFATLPAERRDRFLRTAAALAVLLLTLSIAYFALNLDWPITIDVSSAGVQFLPPNYTVQFAETGVQLVRMQAFALSTVSTASLVAGLLGVALAAGLSLPGAGDRRWGWLLFWTCWGVLILTFSRAGWAIGALVVLLVMWRIGTRHLFAAVAAFLVVGAMLLLIPQVRGRLAEFGDPNEESTAIHFQLWQTAIGFANAQPVFGGGPYSFVDRTRVPGQTDQPPHDFVFEAASDTGWVGAGIIVALVLGMLGYGWKRLRAAPPIAFALWVGLLGAVLMNLTMNGYREDMWWVWAGLMMAVAGTFAVADKAA